MHKIISLLAIAVGLILMAGKIYADGEPGLIPWLLVVVGTGWYFFTRGKTRAPDQA